MKEWEEDEDSKVMSDNEKIEEDNKLSVTMKIENQ